MVGKFVEFHGEGVGAVPLANRATIGNMSPEFGSTCAIFPIDDVTIDYLRLTGRSDEQVALVEAYAKEQGLWHDPSREPALQRAPRARPVDGRAEHRRPEAPSGPRAAVGGQGRFPRGARRVRDPRRRARRHRVGRRRGLRRVVPGERSAGRRRLRRRVRRPGPGRAGRHPGRRGSALAAGHRLARRLRRRASTTAPSPSPRSPGARTPRTPR
nr:aconitase family protein [Angustibacter aerolatus]